MPLQHYITINSISILLLFIALFGTGKRFRFSNTDEKLFSLIIFSTMALLIFDTLMWGFDRQKFSGAYELNVFVTVFYLVLNPAPCIIWAYYVDYKIYGDEKRLKKLSASFIPPFVAISIIVVISVFTGIIFKIDANNVYQRGDYMFLLYIVSYAYYVYSVVITLLNRKKMSNQTFYSILLFAVPALVGSILQGVFFGVALTWPGTAIAILIVFINIQYNGLGTDYLTGMNNRSRLEKYLRAELEKPENVGRLVGVMIDVDKFKTINDRFGHKVGDEALIEISRIINNTVTRRDFACRYAGDEFIFIYHLAKNENVDSLISKLLQNVEESNKKGAKYTISLSYGIEILNDTAISVEEFMCSLDNKLYQHKQRLN